MEVGHANLFFTSKMVPHHRITHQQIRDGNIGGYLLPKGEAQTPTVFTILNRNTIPADGSDQHLHGYLNVFICKLAPGLD